MYKNYISPLGYQMGDMRNRLGIIESGNNYTAHNTKGGGIGAFGKYQIRQRVSLI